MLIYIMFSFHNSDLWEELKGERKDRMYLKHHCWHGVSSLKLVFSWDSKLLPQVRHRNENKVGFIIASGAEVRYKLHLAPLCDLQLHLSCLPGVEGWTGTRLWWWLCRVGWGDILCCVQWRNSGSILHVSSHKTRHMVFLWSPLGSLNHSSLSIPSNFAVVAMEKVEVLPVKDPEPSAALRDQIAKAWTVLHPSTEKLAAPGTINCCWHLAFPPGVQSWASQYHRNNLHVIWNWNYMHIK